MGPEVADSEGVSAFVALAAAISAALGVYALVWAGRAALTRPAPQDVPPAKPLNMVRALRAALTGAELVTLSAGLYFENAFLIGIALIIGSGLYILYRENVRGRTLVTERPMPRNR